MIHFTFGIYQVLRIFMIDRFCFSLVLGFTKRNWLKLYLLLYLYIKSVVVVKTDCLVGKDHNYVDLVIMIQYLRFMYARRRAKRSVAGAS